MLHPLVAADLDRTAALLVEGFPERDPDFWRGALDTLGRHGGNRAADFPPAFLWISGGEPSGVALTPAVLRRMPDGTTRRIVNISSWYVRPEQRWRAPLMLKSLLKPADTLFLDLTPSPAVRRMLPGLGFRPINRGTRVAVLPLAALRRRAGERAVVLAADEDPPEMEGHRALGCVPALVEGPAGRSLVVFRRTRIKGVPAAELVYVESHRALAAAFGALARMLTGRGFVVLRMPALDEPDPFGTRTLPAGLRYAHGDHPADRTDVLGSELTLFNL